MRKKLTSLSLCLLLAAPSFGGAAGAAEPKKPAPPAAEPKGKKEAPAPAAAGGEATKDAARERLDSAINMGKREDYAGSAANLFDYLTSENKNIDEAQYSLAKALYRMGLYHSALKYFTDLLSQGPSGRYYQASLEWCLFVTRKIVADDQVHETVAKYAGAEFPKDYKDEFYFQLARFHFTRAIAIESGALAGALGETRTEETVTGGKSFQGDIFGGEEGGEPPPEKAPAADPELKKKEGGGVSIDEDIFGPGLESDEKKPKDAVKDEPAKKGDKHRRGRRHREKEKEKKVEAPKPEPPKPVAEAPKKPEPEKKKGMVDADGNVMLNAKEHMEEANRLVLRVDPQSSFGPRAKFLEALVLYKMGRENDALDAFKSVVRLTKPGQTGEDANLRELAFFQLARTHFGAKQPSYSIFYYDKVDRDSYGWLDAIYESSWAEFRLGNYEKALGNLLTLHSPFFRDEYYPESLILKAVIYYENCRYPEAKTILSEFLKRYEPVHEELKKLTARDQAPAKYYEILANLRNGGDLAETDRGKAEILSQLLSLALSDNELKHLDASFREVDTELKSLRNQGGGFAGSRLVAQLEGSLGTVRDDLARDAGRAVKRKLEQERDAIKTLIQQAVRIDIETSHSEQERIESTLRDVQSRPKDIEKQFVEWADDERMVWPFSGEYWRDELGTYQLTLAHSCK